MLSPLPPSSQPLSPLYTFLPLFLKRIGKRRAAFKREEGGKVDMKRMGFRIREGKMEKKGWWEQGKENKGWMIWVWDSPQAPSPESNGGRQRRHRRCCRGGPARHSSWRGRGTASRGASQRSGPSPPPTLGPDVHLSHKFNLRYYKEKSPKLYSTNFYWIYQTIWTVLPFPSHPFPSPPFPYFPSLSFPFFLPFLSLLHYHL